MKNFIYAICIISLIQLITSCGAAKGYIGDAVPETELAVIRGESNVTFIKGKKQNERVLLARVDSLTVGSFNKGWPKHVNVKAGKITIEVRHLADWQFQPVYNGGGAIGGVIAATNFEKNNPHYHYILTFEVLKGKQYSIYIKTNEDSIDRPEVYVIEKISEDKIPVEVKQRILNKK